MEQHRNSAFIGDDGLPVQNKVDLNNTKEIEIKNEKQQELNRGSWGKQIEFLLSCIAMSVGLGNIWRFPFTALDNGGGAFLIPYIIVLFLAGKPFYYMEMVIGQFSSSGPGKVWDLCPAMRGVGFGQVIAVTLISTYYVALMALTVSYFVASFQSVLPWSVCDEAWGANCLPSNEKSMSLITNETISNISLNGNFSLMTSNDTLRVSSAELYFLKDVLHEIDNINDGIGLPNWRLVIGLLVSWIIVYVIIIKGVKSSGKASYFLAIFPYVVLGILLIRAVTLPGSGAGMLYFITPQWDQLLSPKVWHAAITQCFFSLSICIGNVIMYSSYNKFDNKSIYRDVTIVTALDTCTSLLAGFTIFGILGHLAHELGTDDISSVVKGDTGLAFISYPDAIARFDFLPQLFSVLFFTMMFTLGIGSNISMTSCTVTAIRDNFPNIKYSTCAFCVILFSFIVGLSYVTPGGQFILTLVDHFGASLIMLVLAIFEILTISWIYGVDRMCKDIEFMTGRSTGYYWRICWGIITPCLMVIILIYALATYEPLKYRDILYPDTAYAIGWTLTAFGIVQVPFWALYAIVKQPGATICEKIAGAFQPKTKWGPKDPVFHEQYVKACSENDSDIFRSDTICARVKRNLFG